jgi:hypothetical protein
VGRRETREVQGCACITLSDGNLYMAIAVSNERHESIFSPREFAWSCAAVEARAAS